MPVPKDEFDRLPPCDFYTPAELLADDLMYSVYEIARLLQGVDVDAELDRETEDILLDWAIPWIMVHADDLVVAEPRTDDEPGYYGLKTEDEGDGGTEATGEDATETDANADADTDTNADADNADDE